MDIILHNVEKTQLPLIRELAKALGLSFEKSEVKHPPVENIYESEEAFDKEMERRFEELESGKVTGYTLEEVKAAAREHRQSH